MGRGLPWSQSRQTESKTSLPFSALPLCWGYSGCFVGQYRMSKFFSTEEACVRKRGHRNIAQSLGQMAVKTAGWPSLLWRPTGPKQRNLRAPAGDPLKQASSGSQFLALVFCTGENGLGVSLPDSPYPAFTQHSFGPRPWQQRERCCLPCRVSKQLEDVAGARESLKTG